MGVTNIILLISGTVVVLFGLGAFLNPNIARWINAPGAPVIKAIIAMVIGVIIIVLSFVIQFPA